MEQITKEELLDVTGKFELGNHIEVVSVEPYGSGHINDTFRLEVKEDGKEKLYILQRMNKDIFKNQKELMDNILQVTSFLTEKIKEQGGLIQTGKHCRLSYQRGKSLSDRGKW